MASRKLVIYYVAIDIIGFQQKGPKLGINGWQIITDSIQSLDDQSWVDESVHRESSRRHAAPISRVPTMAEWKTAKAALEARLELNIEIVDEYESWLRTHWVEQLEAIERDLADVD